MAEHFTIFTHEPTAEFLAALKANNIAVRGWSRRYTKYRNGRHTMKTNQGWINPGDPYGDLKLTVPGSRKDDGDVCSKAHMLATRLGEQYGVEVAIGGCVLGE